ncbi:MAG: pyridoxamine 5'-phosphate oxidase [Actinomycetia bacterium]|nr:pyridoxamine 5'-phosphate oxidase [Actinomycetes bacterium]MCP4221963.1 pyridoxamine 5'-phosphate oxidase [Actinomycetes bacterium]MCP5032745.1 pyridoxamine 5'-phosphate oxidase [Actinomycetes bacterium]
MDLAKMRLEYETAGISEEDLASEPFTQFNEWLMLAVEAEVVEPNAMVVSTVDGDGQPWSRYMLLKKATVEGFDFYTNYESNKSLQLVGQPRAALTFGWLEMRRQVNVAGPVSRVPDPESDEYWAVRPRGSQIGGWASNQSRPLTDHQDLLDRYQKLDADFGETVPRPDHWGGWRLSPTMVEFWQGRQDRLHDRLRYTLVGGRWELSRLAP